MQNTAHDGLFFGAHGPEGWALPPEEWKHALKVLRLPVGSSIRVCDGKGKGALCSIAEGEALEWLEDLAPLPKPNLPLHMAVGMLQKADRFEWMVEKLAELGVEKLYPLLTERSPYSRIKMHRLEKIAQSAMKQSGRFTLMEVAEPMKLEACMRLAPPGIWRLAYCKAQAPKLDWPKEASPQHAVAVGFIGPEGDFTAKEVEMLQAHHAEMMPLGAARLRTETAALLMTAKWMQAQGLDQDAMQQ